jgi:hypothetical protein
VVAQKFVEKVQTMAAAEVEFKSAFVPPFSKREISPSNPNRSLEKREGEIFGRTSGTEH